MFGSFFFFFFFFAVPHFFFAGDAIATSSCSSLNLCWNRLVWNSWLLYLPCQIFLDDLASFLPQEASSLLGMQLQPPPPPPCHLCPNRLIYHQQSL
jgi:hypothetical protein